MYPILVEEYWEGMPYSICCCHQGFTTWHRLKDEEEKQLPADNGGSKILCSPRSRDFRHGPLRYASLFFIPICLSLFYVCDMLLSLFAFATSNYILLVPCFNTRLSSKGLGLCEYSLVVLVLT